MAGCTLFLLLLIQFFSFISTQQINPESLCMSQQSCSSCLQTPRCVWCATKVANQTRSSPLIRCITREEYRKQRNLWCTPSDVINDTNEITIVENRTLSSRKGTTVVQIQPQRIKLKLRRGEAQKITLRYSQAEDYPVDLYYIMDLTYTMRYYKDTLSELGGKIAEAMQDLTSNFRLGFGSFVDKVVSPMVYKATGNNFQDPYGFKHHMSLSQDVELFNARVREANISGNADLPEGGFDALMQAIVCSEVIGWREHARHLIVFSTDSESHIAGDGRIAGTIEPNDCLCHMDDKGYYTYSLLQDYPSIGQINKVAREYDVNIIFGVTRSIIPWYKRISERVTGSSIGTINVGKDSVVNIISGEYDKLAQSVVLVDNVPKMIDIKYFSRCLKDTTELQERQECGGLRADQVVDFEVVLKAVECPKNSSEWQKTIQIKPRGINESLTIDLSIVCDCPCERSRHPGYQPDSEDCGGNGNLVCGVCVCNDGFYGNNCECKGTDAKADRDADVAECRPNNETTEICNSRGVCRCGVCNCMKRQNPKEIFYGRYCECDNFSCKRSNQMVCNGQGTCECGTCNCHPEWSGAACDCRETNRTCLAPGMEKICNGHGDCVCGSCQCHEKDNIRYSGEFCEYCPTCPVEYCEALKDCVECYAYKTGPYSQNGKCDLCPHEIDIVDAVKVDSVKDPKTGAKVCRMPGDAGCSFIFKYYQRAGGSGGDIKIFKILAQKEKMCPEPLNIFGIAIGLIVTTVFLGFLVVFIWKISMMIHDKREYAKFVSAQAVENRGENPLYRQATSTFRNPTFRVSLRD